MRPEIKLIAIGAVFSFIALAVRVFVWKQVVAARTRNLAWGMRASVLVYGLPIYFALVLIGVVQLLA